ncbi:MAG: hypothetical protein PHO37_10265 [Kiritimatiellae bacterium]|nr:hypothetical protein [Kiritimatiellia bacterium]
MRSPVALPARSRPAPYSFGLTIARLAHPWPLAACKSLGWCVSCTSRSTVAAGRDRGGALVVNRLTADGSRCTPLSLRRRGHGQPPYSFDLLIARLSRSLQLAAGVALHFRFAGAVTARALQLRPANRSVVALLAACGLHCAILSHAGAVTASRPTASA